MKLSSTYLSQSLGSWSAVISAVSSNSSMKSPAPTGERGDPIAVPSVLFEELVPIHEVRGLEAELCQQAHLLWCHGCTFTKGLIKLQSIFDDDQYILHWDLSEEAFHIKTDQAVGAVSLHR